MSDNTPTPSRRKCIDGIAFRRHMFRELGVDVGAVEGGNATPDEQITAGQAVSSAPGTTSHRPSTGYKNPPQATRFTKGQSGNPKGRPKRNDRSGPKANPDGDWTGFEQALVTHLLKPMSVRENGEVREVDAIEGIVALIKQLAAKGSIRMTELWVRLIERASRLEAESLAREHAKWQDYIDTYPERVRRAKEDGVSLAEWMPHPEDISILPGKDVRIQGYSGEETYRLCRLLKQVRDALTLRMLYDNELFFARPGSKASITGADLIPVMLDHFLPKRWQFHATEHQKAIALWTWTSRDRLRAALKDAFAALNWPLDLTHPAPYVSDKHLKKLNLDPKWVRKRSERDGRGGRKRTIRY